MLLKKKLLYETIVQRSLFNRNPAHVIFNFLSKALQISISCTSEKTVRNFQVPPGLAGPPSFHKDLEIQTHKTKLRDTTWTEYESRR